MRAFIMAMRARSMSMSTVGVAMRPSARLRAVCARATSISSAFSAVCARIVTRSGSTSAKPNAAPARRTGTTHVAPHTAHVAPLLRCLPLPELLDDLVDRPGHVEILLRDLVVPALDDLLEAADGVGNGHVFAFEPRELLGDE